MAYYSHTPQFQLYAYAPMPIAANPEFYAVYPSGHPHHGVAGPLDASQFYYEPAPKGNYMHNGKHHSRKESTDSGISNGSMSRKTSTISQLSSSSIIEEPSQESKESDKEDQPFVEPDDDLCEKITQQVEFYFSDANITKDKFLLKHVKRNKEGFVSLKLISSFKRVKHLTKDWRQVAFAIKKCSKRLEVNDLETKVRRLEELPPYDETTPSRTVVVLNLPMERPTIEGVAEIFRACGDIVLVRILRPGNPVPADIKQYVAKHPEMTTKVCALVEFERTEFAQKAVKELNDTEDEEKMKVMELTATPLKNGNKKIEARKLAEKAAAMAKAAAVASAGGAPVRKYSLQNNYGQAPVMAAPPRARRISLMHNMKFSPICEDLKENVVPRKQEYSLNPNAPSFQMNEDGTFQMIPPMAHHHHHHQRRRPVVYVNDEPQFVSVPASGRRMGMAQAVPYSVYGSSGYEAATAGLKLPPNVVRLPKGPVEHQGKGFNNWCRQRMTTDQPKQRVSKAIPIVAPPPAKDEKEALGAVVKPEEKKAEEVELARSADTLQVPSIQVEAASASEAGSEDEAGAAAAATPDSCDSGHEDSGSEPDFEAGLAANERTR